MATRKKTSSRAKSTSKPAARKRTTAKPATKSAASTAKATAAKPAATKPTASKPEPKAATPVTSKPVAASEPKPAATPKAEPKAATAPKAEPAPAKAAPAPKAAAKPQVKAAEKSTPAKPEAKPSTPAEKPAAKAAPAPKAEPAAKPAAATAPKPETKPEPKAEPKPEQKPAAKPEPKPAAAPAAKAEPKPATATKPAAKPEPKPAAKPESKPAPAPKAEPAAKPEPKAAAKAKPEPKAEPAPKKAPAPLPQPRRSICFIGSECYPFVKTGGLGDVMYALPKALVAQNCDVKVILPRYACIKEQWQEKMVYRGSFDMDLCADGRSFYVGIMEYVADSGVVYDFIDNQDFFSYGNPYTNLVDDIPRYCYFSKAALAALNYLDWTPDVIHCHDWQAGLVPLFLKTMFQNTPLGRSKVVLTIHNLRFQGKYNIPTIKYWTNLPDYVFNEGALQQDWTEANILKGGLAYADMITTVSGTYAQEIQSPEYGEGLDAHLRYHSWKLRGIVNGIDVDIWDPARDTFIQKPYDAKNVIANKKEDKRALQEELGLEVDDAKMVIGLISRLTDQKGLDLVNAVIPGMVDGNTQVVLLGTGDAQYEDSFRYYENTYKGTVCSNIMYDEARSHQIYAGADALMVPSRFEPCGLTQLIAMRYGTIPIVRETGGLKDTVEPYNKYSNEGNGFTFDRYDAGLLYDAINRAKTLYFTNRWCWDEMVKRDMNKDVSWEKSAKQYRDLYLELTQ
jgi:starch synthase